MYLRFSPLGEISTTPANAPCFLFDPSMNIFQEFERLGGPGVCTSIHLTRKSGRTWALIDVGCLNCRSRGLSFIFHCATRPIVSGLLRMPESGVLLMCLKCIYFS